MWGKILTLDQIQRQGWSLTNWCFFYLDVKNLLIICCSIVKWLGFYGSWFLCFLGAFFVGERDTLLVWCGYIVGKKCKKVWQATLLCFFWMVWRARNNIAFDNVASSIQKLKRDFVSFLWAEPKVFGWLPTIFSRFLEWLGTYSVLFCLSLGGEGRFVFLVHFELLILAALLF